MLFLVRKLLVSAICPVMKHNAKVLTMAKETDLRFIKEVKQKIYNDIMMMRGSSNSWTKLLF